MTAQLPSREILQKIIETANEIITVNNGTNEDIWENDTATIISLYDRLNDDLASPSVVKVLAEFALAAHEQEPVAYIFKHPSGRLFWSLSDESTKDHKDVFPVYTHSAPVTAVSTRERLATLQLASIINDLGLPENAPFVEITSEIFRLKQLESPVPAVPENPPFAVMQRALDAFYAESDEVPENQMLAAYRVFHSAMLNGGKS